MSPARPVWADRTGVTAAADFAHYSASTEDDAPYMLHDIIGSLAHVHGLSHAGLLDAADAQALTEGLQALHEAWQAGHFTLDPALEDGHMNLEAALGERVGDAAARLHTGRSRNDQVATCITLFARQGLLDAAVAAHALAQATADAAREHAATPWTARTHGQPAQPATLGFLLMAHAHRIQDTAQEALHLFDTIGESPLGCGAVAGSTLPLDPAYTADLLGLRPPRNALLATGTRDTVLAATAWAGKAGVVLADLAEDLMRLHQTGAFHVPDGYATGSSLMPQKRNPDALELARGTARQTIAINLAVAQIVAGLGLGYQRDLQCTKPWLTRAMQDSTATFAILAGVFQGGRFEAPPASDDPGLVATDVAEALVATGTPFRTAYRLVASAYHDVAKGTPLEEALATHVGPDTEAVWRPCLDPDPARRDTLGGPAPVQVEAQCDAFQARQASLQTTLDTARCQVEQAESLLGTARPGLHAGAPQGGP